jgi:hypothetical protein
MALNGRIWNRRAMESLGILMIGGVVGSVGPARHCSLWRRGPAPWTRVVSFFARHPNLTRAVALPETGAGLWLATRQLPRSLRGLRM